MGTVQHRQTFIAQYQICWIVSSIGTGRLAERRKPGNSIVQKCSSGKFSSEKVGAEHTETKHQPIYIVSDLNHTASSSYVCMSQCLWVRRDLHTPYKDMYICLVKCTVSLLEICPNYFTSTTTITQC